MSRWAEATVFAAMVLTALTANAQGRYPGIGRTATPAEIAAWDIDVRADFKGLPKGEGNVSQGETIWEAKCASCHGSFGESNAVFPPITGGVKPADIERGRVEGLVKGEDQRTTVMKLARISTLWDYINRAMPWNAPKTLTVDEVYAVTAYILKEGGIVDDKFVLSDRNMAEVQKRMPSRNALSRNHGMWDTAGRPDVIATACMINCGSEPKITSSLPDHARGSHGDLALQNRIVGPVRGVALAGARGTTATASAAPAANPATTLAEKSGCLSCHNAKQRLVGPSLTEVAAKYRNDAGAEGKLVSKVKLGGQGVWGSIPMPPHAQLPDQDVRTLVRWFLKPE